jgi:hypothetical protein
MHTCTQRKTMTKSTRDARTPVDSNRPLQQLCATRFVAWHANNPSLVVAHIRRTQSRTRASGAATSSVRVLLRCAMSLQRAAAFVLTKICNLCKYSKKRNTKSKRMQPQKALLCSRDKSRSEKKITQESGFGTGRGAPQGAAAVGI